jgi:transposase, IS30 family
LWSYAVWGLLQATPFTTMLGALLRAEPAKRTFYFEVQRPYDMRFHMSTYKHFNKDERLHLAILLKRGCSLREIAGVLGRNPSSVSREITSNSVQGVYDPGRADRKAYIKRYNSKYRGMKIRKIQWLEEYIREKIRPPYYWTPQQIAGRLKEENNGNTVITHKIIYEYLYSEFGQCLWQYLPSRKYYRKKRKGKKQPRVMIKNRIGIEKRPAVVNRRKRYGDFEGDTLGVPKTSKVTLAGLVDRKSRYFAAKKISRLAYTIDAFKELSTPLSVKSYTFDNGVENARHGELGLPVYFCNAYSSWEKGGIENTFQRLRRFIPKKDCIYRYSDKQISDIVAIMNDTPRKCLNYRTPREVLERKHIVKRNITIS